MTPFIALTDKRWFDFLSTQAQRKPLDEVNFWQPRATRPMKQMQPGEPVFFRLKRPHYAIAGYGFFAHFQVVPVEDAWELFGWKNGDASLAGFLSRIGGYRQEDLSLGANRRKPIGCTLLREARFWPDPAWIPWGDEKGWAQNIVQGKTETDATRAAELMARIRTDAAATPEDLVGGYEPLHSDDRTWVERIVPQRTGQGTFRLRLLDSYGRCAVTGEKTRPVLDGAHIQPYMGPRSNHVQNGLLLTKEFHTLFDRGYVTVTPDYKVRVSSALREHYSNGKRYYEYDGAPLRRLPDNPAHHPSRAALEWHRDTVFQG
jgi:putative restriction endonuclease